MTRPAVAPTLAVLTLAVLTLGACANLAQETRAGVGQLVVTDLEKPEQVGHFTGTPVPLTARIDVTSTGCVYLVMDGVERYPFWPAGTTVEQVPDQLGSYVVNVPGSTTLATGDSFEALGVIDDATGPFIEDSLAAMLLGYCDIDGAPVAIFDAASITPLDD